MRLRFSLSLFFGWVALVDAQYKIYQPKNQVIFGGSALTYTNTATATATGTAAFANYTAAAEYDPTTLNAPAVPDPPIPTVVPVQLPSSGGLANLSAPVNGAFFGFSVEMSVSNQVCESSQLSPLGALTKGGPLSQWARTGALLAVPALTPRADVH